LFNVVPSGGVQSRRSNHVNRFHGRNGMQRNPWQDLDWRLAVAAIAGCAATFVTAVLVTRLSAAPQSLSPWWTLATALLVGGLSSSCVELLERHAETPSRRMSRIVGAIFASGVTSLAILATTRQAGAVHLAFACTLSLLFSATAVGWAVGMVRQPGNVAHESPPGTVDTIPLAGGPPVDERDGDFATEPETSGQGLPDHVEQTLSRYLADGKDVLEACLRVRFEPGQQTAVVHLPIQPAMQFDPEVECEPIGDDDLRITVDPAQPYGVRLVCRRPAPCTGPGESTIAVLVSADRAAARAVA
jgi:hypothetical protein